MGLEELTQKYEHPIIAVIGATQPLPDYEQKIGESLGYKLRELLEKQQGTIFTGGVPGVGVDIYQGVINYCQEHSKSNDKFFCLLPEEYPICIDYLLSADEIGKNSVSIERIGKDMEERRTNLSNLADCLIVVNGSHGTLDEALKSMLLGKKLLCLANSGGAAKVLEKIKLEEIQGLPKEINSSLIELFYNVDDLIAYLEQEYGKRKN